MNCGDSIRNTDERVTRKEMTEVVNGREGRGRGGFYI